MRIEILLPFLDFESTLKLAQSHALTLNILQIDSNWKKLFRRFHARKADEKWQYDTRFKLEIEEPLLSALSTILSKQERVETHYTFSSVKIQTVKSALASRLSCTSTLVSLWESRFVETLGQEDGRCCQK